MAEKISKEKMLYGIIIFLAISLSLILYQNYIAAAQKTARQEAVVEKVKKIYETLTESPTEILSVKEEGGMYRVILRAQNLAGSQEVQEVLISSDGTYFTDRAFNTQAFLDRVTKEKAFAECIASKQLLVFGQSNEINTQAQLQILGSFWRKFYIDCIGTNLQLCQQVGITQVPTTVYNNTSYIGVQPLQLYEQLTGCTMI